MRDTLTQARIASQIDDLPSDAQLVFHGMTMRPCVRIDDAAMAVNLTIERFKAGLDVLVRAGFILYSVDDGGGVHVQWLEA